MTIQHSVIPDAQLHEPKGIVSAASGKVYVANGAGSGVWQYPSGQRFAELYITSGATTQALTTTAARLDPGTAWTQGVIKGLTTTAGDGTITLTGTGNYEVAFWISFNTDAVAAGTLYTFYYALDGVLSVRSISVQKLTAGVDSLNCSAFGFITATAGQVLSIYAKSSIASTITPVEAGLSANLLSE